MDVDGNTYTDLILISAPMFVDKDCEGRVYICTLSGLVNILTIFLIIIFIYIYIYIIHFYSKFWLPLLFCQTVKFQGLFLRGSASNAGRFGSSLAVLPDLNADGFNDLAIGAPLENNGQGSIYIFHGEGSGRISQTYSQVNERHWHQKHLRNLCIRPNK